MIFTKMKFGKVNFEHIDYALREWNAGKGDALFFNTLESSEGAAKSFQDTQDILLSRKQQNRVLYFEHSLSHEESNQMTTKNYKGLVEDIYKEFFKGHQTVIGIHKDTKHHHAHFVINICSFETGKTIQNKGVLGFKKKMMDFNDQKAKELGFKIPERKGNSIEEKKLPSKTRDIISRNIPSYKRDFMEKANFARSVSTNFNDYNDILHGFGIQTRVEKKNITYFYPDKKKGFRGGKAGIGENYAKDGLIKGFIENEKRFRANPELRSSIINEFKRNRTERGIDARDSSSLSMQRPFDERKAEQKLRAFTSEPRRIAKYMSASSRSLNDSWFPISEIDKAQNNNLLDYLKKNKIQIEKSQNGELFLKNRKHLKVNQYGWENTKNNTQGGFIEFYQIHKKTGYIRAISEINNNKRLLIFEQYKDQSHKPYYSFHVPKPDKASREKSLSTIKDFLSGGFSKSNQFAMSLFNKDKLQVDKNRKIHFISEDERTSEEYWKDDNGNWKSKKHGKRNNLFFQSKKKGNKAIIFTSPESFAKQSKDEISKLLKSDRSVFVFFEDSQRAFDGIIGGNKHIKNLQVVPNNSSKNHIIFMDKLKSRYKNFGLELNSSTNLNNSRLRSDLEIDR